jgi:hypothetical protein
LPLIPLHICEILALVLPIEDFGGRSSVLLAVAFLEIGLRLSLDSRLPEVADPILIQKMVNVLFYTLLLLTAESGVLYFVLVRIVGICDENPQPEDSCEESNLDRGARVTAHVINSVFALFALCPLRWVASKMLEADEALKAWEHQISDANSDIPTFYDTYQTGVSLAPWYENGSSLHKSKIKNKKHSHRTAQSQNTKADQKHKHRQNDNKY